MCLQIHRACSAELLNQLKELFGNRFIYALSLSLFPSISPKLAIKFQFSFCLCPTLFYNCIEFIVIIDLHVTFIGLFSPIVFFALRFILKFVMFFFVLLSLQNVLHKYIKSIKCIQLIKTRHIIICWYCEYKEMKIRYTKRVAKNTIPHRKRMQWANEQTKKTVFIQEKFFFVNRTEENIVVKRWWSEHKQELLINLFRIENRRNKDENN